MTRRLALALGALLAAVLLAATGDRRAAQDPAQRFVALDVFVDAGAHPLAAWQVDVRFAAAKLVGVEGGAPDAFRAPPTYDPAALARGRVVLAALASEPARRRPLPTGRVRVARLHVQTTAAGVPEHDLLDLVVADADGNRIEADLEVRRKEDK